MRRGIFVLGGKLRTEDGAYRPVSFLWSVEDIVTCNDATDDEDCLSLFFSSPRGAIEFVDPPEEGNNHQRIFKEGYRGRRSLLTG